MEEPAFFNLFDRVIAHIEAKPGVNTEKWLPTEEAMKRLGITSKATLQSYRDEGKIRFTQPRKKVILYDSNSIDDFLNKHAKNTF